MLMFHNYEGKNFTILKEICQEELGLSEESIYYLEEEKESGLFKGKKCYLTAITEKEIINSIKEFIKNLSINMGIDINSEIKIQDKNINIILVSDNNNVLIGKDGKILNSIQLILRQIYSDLNKFGLKITLDVGNYRAKKIKNLEIKIKDICKEVLNTKIDAKLDPMNSYERRIIHSIVSEYENLESISEGVEPNRYTIIKYKD